MDFLEELPLLRKFSKRVGREEGESFLKYWKRVNDAYHNLDDRRWDYDENGEPDTNRISLRVSRRGRGAVFGTDIRPIDKINKTSS